MKLLDRLVEYLSVMNIKMRRWRRVISVMSAIVVFVTTYALVLPAITLDVDTASIQSGIEVATENEAAAAGTVFESTPEEEPEAEPAEEEPEADPAEDAEAEDEESESAEPAGEEEDADAEEPASNEEEDSADEAETVSPENEDAQSGSDDSTSDEEAEETPSAETPSNEEAVPAATEAESAETAKTVITEETPLITEKTQLTYKEKDKDYVVYADFDESAKLPVGVELKVREITKEDDPDTYKIYYDKALEGLKDKYDENTGLSFARFYDIAFVFEGQEIEPKGNVAIKIEYKEAVEIKEEIKVDAIHFDEKDVEKEEMKAEIIDSEKEVREDEDTTKVESVGFESDKFSVYGVIGAETFTEKFLTEDGETYNISVTAGADAHIPAGAALEISEVKEGSDKYDELFEKAQAAVTDGNDASVPFARFFDIAIVKDGEKIQPDAPVDVKISFDETVEANKNAVFNAVHIADDDADAEVIDVTTEGEETDEAVTVEAVKFAAEGFSYYGITYTVDFETIDGGKYSIPGEGSYKLNDLLSYIIGKEGTVSDATLELVEGEFSEGALYLTQGEDEDWYINSDVAFDNTYLLTMTVDGVKYEIKVTDENSYSANLADFLDSVNINADKEDGKYVIKPGKQYSASLVFIEDQEGFQFNEDGHLEYTLPDGFNPANTSGTFTIDAEYHQATYPVEGNTYRVENGKLIIDLNTDSPNYRFVQASSNTSITVDISGTFDITKNTINWSDTISTDIKPDLDQGVSIEKSISHFDPTTGVITYHLKVKSLNGTNTNIVVSDQMDGTAVVVNEDVSLSGAAMSSEGVTYERLGYEPFTTNGFHFTIPSMAAGAEATVIYTATIDKEKLISGGVNLDYEGKNTVTAKPDEPGKPDSSSSNLKNTITAPSLSKSATVSDVVNGKRTITWTIVATSNDYFPLAGGTITDTIQADSRADMKYSGDNLIIVVTDGNGSSTTREVSWAQVGVFNKNEAYSWTYNVPSGDTGNKTYTITYTTEVDVSDYAADAKVKNDVEDAYKETTGTADVGPEGENEKAKLDKTVSNVTMADIAWDVNITVPVQGLNKAVLTDDLPTQFNNTFHDTLQGSLDDVQVNGLLEGQEKAVKSYENHKLVINFQKNVNGQWVDGLIGGDSPRTITVSFTTDNDPNWINAAATQSWLLKHVNNVKFEANRQVLTDSAEATPMESTFEKKAGNSGEVTVDGVKLPIYYYTINLTGVTGPFDIVDTFDERLVPAEISVYSEQGKVYGGNQDYQGTSGTEPASIETSDEGGRMTLHVTEASLAKNGTAYYSHYKIVYALRVKDAEALDSLKAEATAAQGGKITLGNEAESPYGSDDATVTYEHKGLTKELLNNDELGGSNNIGQFRITVNPNGFDMDPDSEMITLTDTFSNTLSIDYNSVKVEPSEGVTWYYSGNQAVFTLPDETPIVITYNARIIGTGSVHIENTAEINGQKSIISEDETIDSSAGGTSGNYNINVLKHKRYDFTEVLGGVTFGLYDASNDEPIKDNNNQPVTFRTNEDGTAHIEGSQADNGWSIIAGKMYYLKELEAPEGYTLSSTKYRFRINKDNKPDYENNIYFKGDTLHINNTPKGGLEVKKSVYGVELDDAQKNAIVFTVTKPDGTTVSKKYSEFVNGKWKLFDLPAGTYTVTETCGEVEGYERTTSYSIDGSNTTEGTTAEVVITDPSKETSVSFVNRYRSTVIIEPDTLQLRVQKKWFVGDVDKSTDDSFASKKAVINLKRYRAEQPTTTLEFYRTIDTAKTSIDVPVVIPAGATVSITPSKGTNIRPMKVGANGIYNGDGYDNAKYSNPGYASTFDFSAQSNVDKIEIWFQDDPGEVTVSYTGGSTASEADFTADTYFVGDSATITGGGSKTFNNLPLSETVDGKNYVYKYYIEETAMQGFTTQYQVDSGEFKDSIPVSDAIGTEGSSTIVVKNTSELGSLKLTKAVTVNSAPATTTAADGEYSFTIAGVGPDGSTGETVATVVIKVENGVATQYKLNNAESFTDLPADKYAIIPDLAVGDYVITESAVEGMTVSSITGGKGDGNTTTRTITVTVSAGDTQAAQTTAQAAYTNDKQLGSLDITKNIQTNGVIDSTKTGTFYYAIYKKAYSAEVTQEPVATGSITVTEYGTNTVTVDNLPYGTYYVYELDNEGGTPITSGNDGVVKAIGNTVYKVSGSGATVAVSETKGTAVLNNNVETVKAKVVKVWNDNNDGSRPTSLNVSLYSNVATSDSGDSAEGTDAEDSAESALVREVVLNASNDWGAGLEPIVDLPKYDKNGNEILYHWVEGDMPDRYFLTNVESTEDTVTGVVTTTLTNTLEKYDLKTSYVGTKTWEDNSNGWKTRPTEFTVTLYEIKKVNGSYPETGTALTLTPEWKKDEATNQWVYTFSNLPVFDDNGEIIKYYAEETVPGGYTKTSETNTPTTWAMGEITYKKGDDRITPDNKILWQLGSLIDLAFIAIKPTAHGDVPVWTSRIPTPSEKEAIEDELAAGALPGCAGRNIHYYYGTGSIPLPLGTVTVIQNGLDVTLDLGSQEVSAQFIVGQFNKNDTSSYNIGTTSFTNTLEETVLTGTKSWKTTGTTQHDNATDVTLKLTRTSAKEGSVAEIVYAKSDTEKTVYSDVNTGVFLQPDWDGNSYKYDKLPAKDKEGYSYTYTVAEHQFKVGNTVYTAVKDENGNYTVTSNPETAAAFTVVQNGNDLVNTETKIFEFTKIWKTVDNNIEDWPDNKTITVKLYSTTGGDNRVLVDTFTLDKNGGRGTTSAYVWTAIENSDNTYTFKIIGLPAVDGNSLALEYFVTEDTVDGYQEPEYAKIVAESEATDGTGETSRIEGKRDTDPTKGKALNGEYVINRPQDAVTLPESGGPGTKLFYGLGISFVGFAGLLLFIKRRELRDLSKRRW